ncbi:MAG TPA: DUF1080 domain-containing protein [Bryobacteraceae bacterium]|nr:DUF1080 domain-containing protein [Bryobacteraceae bacterium]
MRLVCAAALTTVVLVAGAVDDQQFNGRWDITVAGEPRARAWWLEVLGAGTDTIKGKFVGAPGGQIEEIPKISVYDGELRFSFDRRYRRDGKSVQRGLYWARLEDGKLKGTFEIEGEPASYLEWTGVRSPAIADKDDLSWKRGDPVMLFDGRELTGWSQSPAPGHGPGWSVKQGLLTNAPGAGNLISDKKFWNFTLHVEFRIPPGSNSGIGLRGRYELQIVDDIGKPPTVHGNGAIYGRIAPAVNASKEPDEWQALDVRLVGRQVSVTLNGIKIIDNKTIEGITAIALDSNEADPGPIVIQGDQGPIEIRRIVLYPLTKTH